MTPRTVPWEIDSEEDDDPNRARKRVLDLVESDGNDLEPELESALDSGQEANYACWACGEEIVIPVDLTMGAHQKYVEDCPVCCRPNEIHLEIEPGSGHVRCWNDPVG